MYFRNTLEALRRKFGLTFYELSDETHMAASYLKNLEDGKRGLPKDQYILKLGEAYSRLDKPHGENTVGLDSKMDFVALLFKVVEFERSIILHKSFIWYNIEKIINENYHSFSSTDKEGLESEQVLRTLVMLAGHKALTLKEYRDMDEEAVFNFRKTTKRIFECLKDKIEEEQIVVLSHFVKCVSMDCEAQSVKIIFTNDWLQNKFDAIGKDLQDNILYNYLEACSFEGILNKKKQNAKD
jgi:hypothetical protein